MSIGPSSDGIAAVFELGQVTPWPPVCTVFLGIISESAGTEKISVTLFGTPASTILAIFSAAKGQENIVETLPITLPGERDWSVKISTKGADIRIAAGEQIIFPPVAAHPIHSGVSGTQLFDGARLKLFRAEKHIRELEASIATLIKSKPYEVVKEPNEDGKTYRRIVRLLGTNLADLSLPIGDAIHNLRTALDHLACDLARKHCGDAKNVYFPFAESGADIDRMIKDRRFDKAGAQAVALLKTLKPYRGGNDLLRAIHDLDISDKHKLIIPTIGFVSQPVTEIDYVAGFRFSRVGAAVALEDGAILDAAVPNHIEINDHYAIVEIRFGQGQPLAGLEVVKTLKGMAQLTDDVIKAFLALP